MQFRVIVVTDPQTQPQTHKQTGPITIHCAAASAQCNEIPAFADICLSAYKKLFSAVIRDSDHVLHKLLPPLSTASQSYNLRERKHNLLPLRTGRLSDHNFIQRMLYLDAY